MPPQSHLPRQFHGVMVSSTFVDLKSHRAALIETIHAQPFAAVVMEKDTAKPTGDVIESSLRMVSEAAACVVLIGVRYGDTPTCSRRNPDNLSLSELEFNEAQRIERPILLFLAENHPFIEEDFENDHRKKEKLKAFRERAKRSGSNSLVNRVYDTFKSLEDFKEKINRAIPELLHHLEKASAPISTSTGLSINAASDPIPAPPAFYAEPRYAASHKFVGREAELNILSDWASPADPYPILLFDAIGGSGKSMLTWHWTTTRATQLRPDWAGRFWYSFYERGAIMADFCRHALAYITRQPVETFNKSKTPELGRQLLHHLQTSTWLFILDGLERVLVAYNRNDAAELSDEDAANPTDQIANRDPCASIRPEDDDVLRALATASPSKLLITSRLPPRAILNAADQEIPGVRRAPLRGLRPADAELLFRSCGVSGGAQEMQSYLQTHCDCHPLTTGVLAGLVRDYLPDKGNFAAWSRDPDYGGQLNFADLNLVQKRNHILNTAIAGLSTETRRLFSMLALLSQAADYPTLKALNPYLSAQPEEIPIPLPPSIRPWMSVEMKLERQRAYEYASQSRKEFLDRLDLWQKSPQQKIARQLLDKSIQDLQDRGLVQYDELVKRYDLHPVVRGVATARLETREMELYGQRAIDFFSAKAHNPYKQAETFDDVRDGVQIVRMLMKMGRIQQAADAFNADLSQALLHNLEADELVLALLKPCFPLGWDLPLTQLREDTRSVLSNDVRLALISTDQLSEAFRVLDLQIQMLLQKSITPELAKLILMLVWVLLDQKHLAQASRILESCRDLVSLLEDGEASRLEFVMKGCILASLGQGSDAEAAWNAMNELSRAQGLTHLTTEADPIYAEFCLERGTLEEEQLARFERLATGRKNRIDLRTLRRIRGEWHLEKGEWLSASENLQEAVSMARAISNTDAASETLLALTQLTLGQLAEPRQEALRLAKLKKPAHLALAQLWIAIGDLEQAMRHAIEEYRDAWADGEPYVFRVNLNKARALLEKLGGKIPVLPPYDPSKEKKFPWEDNLIAAVERLREEKEAKAASTSVEGEA